jgi:hypothetical protein
VGGCTEGWRVGVMYGLMWSVGVGRWGVGGVGGLCGGVTSRWLGMGLWACG